MAILQPSEREVRDLIAGTLAAEAFDQKYGIGASNEYLQLSQPSNVETVEDTVQQEEDKRNWVKDIGVGAVKGVARGIEAATGAAAELGDTLREKGVPLPVFDITNKKFYFDQEEIDKLKERSGGSVGEKFTERLEDSLPDPERLTGNLTSAVTQFGLGFVTGKKLIGVGTLALKPKKFVTLYNSGKNVIAAAFADGAFFDSYESRLSDLINEHAPWASNSLTEYLAADPEDTFWEGRFKNVIEGGIIGGVADSIFLLARTYKRYRTAKKNKEVDKLLNDEQFVKDTDELTKLVGDLDSSIREADDEAIAASKEIETNKISEREVAPAVTRFEKKLKESEVKETPELPPRDESSGHAADGVPAQYGSPAHDLNFKMEEEFSPEGYSTYSTDVGKNYEKLPYFISSNPKGDKVMKSMYKDEVDFIKKLKEIRGNPDAVIRMYRAAPTDELREGDLITPSKAEAKFYVDESKITQADIRKAEKKRRLDTDEPIDLQKEKNIKTIDNIVDILGGDRKVTHSKIHKYDLKASEVRWDGNNGMLRWGYFPEKVVDFTKERLRRTDDAVVREVEKTTSPLKEKNIDEIVARAKDEHLGFGQSTVNILLRQVDELKKTPRGETPPEIDLDTGINPKNLTGTDSDALVFDIVTNELKKNSKKLQAIERQVVVKNAADILARNPNDVLLRIDKLAKATKNSTETLLAAVSVAQTYANAIPRIARQILAQSNPAHQKFLAKQDQRVADKLGISLEEARANRVEWKEQDLRNVISFLGKIVLDEKWVEKQFGRGIAIRKVKADPADVSLNKITADLARFDGDFNKFMRQSAVLDQDAKGIMKLLRYVFANRGWDLANEIWINFLLSSPRTHFVNITSNIGMALLRPAENYTYGLMSGNKELREDAARQIVGMFHFSKDFMRWVKLAWTSQDSVLDKGFTKVEGVENATDLVFGKTGGGIARMSTRILTLEDEIFKSLAYRGRLYSNTIRKAEKLKLSKKKNPDTGTSEYEDFVMDEFDKGFDQKTGLAQNTDALDYAREVTFTKELDPTSFSGRTSQWVNDNPAARQLLPFIRTPVNIAVNAFERTPLGLLKRDIRNKVFGNFKADPYLTLREVQEARAKLFMGSMLLTTAGMLAHNGLITGGGVRDPDDRQRLYKTGWLPYSFKIGDRYIPYGRIEPLSMVFGTLADFIEMNAELLPEDQMKISEALQLAFYSKLLTTGTSTTTRAVARNMVSKTYLKGFTEVLEAILDEDGWRMERWMNNAISSRVLPSFARNMNTDPYYRQARTLLDRIAINTPFFSKYKEPRFDFMGEKALKVGTPLGRLLNPFMTTEDTGDLVYQTLTELNHSFSPAPETKNGVQLSAFVMKDGKNAYWRWNELIQEQNLRQKIEDKIKEEGFKDLTDPYRFDEKNYYTGGKIAAINQLVEDAREDALYQLFLEKPMSKENDELDLETAIYFNKANRVDWNNNYKNKINDLFQIK